MIEKKTQKENSYLAEADKCPKEFYNLKDYYAITIAPANQHQYFHVKGDRLRRWKEYWKSLLIDFYNNGTTYIFNIESSQHGRLHLHGILKFSTNAQILSHYVNAIPSIEDKAKLEIKKVTNFYNWRRYCEKQHHIIMSAPISNMYNDWDGLEMLTLVCESDTS